MTDVGAMLLGFAEAYPVGPEGDSMRRLGRQAGYPACCVEFYVAIIPLVWARVAPAEAYWQAVVGHDYVPCPRCLDVPLDKSAYQE